MLGIKRSAPSYFFSRSSLFAVLASGIVACGAAPDEVAATDDALDTASAEAAASPTRYTVDRGTDGTDGVCRANRSSDGQCNLRAAVAAALGARGPVTIILAVDSQITAGEIAV